MEEEQVAIITMIDQDTNEQIDFAIIDAVDYNGKKYVLAVEESEIESDEAEAYIFRMEESPDSDEEYLYVTVEDEEEFDEIQTVFMEKDPEEFEIKTDEL